MGHMPDLQYPIGKFVYQGRRDEWLAQLEAAPALLCRAVEGLDDQQLDTPYRPGGWTVRQVIHHVADSHMNCYVRFRCALTEAEPTIKPYDEKLWAELADARTEPVELSLKLIEAMHRRWMALCAALEPPAFAKTYRHPEYGLRTLDETLALYAWHSRHHTAHITGLRERMGW
jgi:hypothetical protein